MVSTMQALQASHIISFHTSVFYQILSNGREWKGTASLGSTKQLACSDSMLPFWDQEENNPCSILDSAMKVWRTTGRNSTIKGSVTRQILVIFVIIYSGKIFVNALCGKGAFNGGLEYKPLAVPKWRSPLLKSLACCPWKQIIKATVLPLLVVPIHWQKEPFFSFIPLISFIIWHLPNILTLISLPIPRNGSHWLLLMQE